MRRAQKDERTETDLHGQATDTNGQGPPRKELCTLLSVGPCPLKSVLVRCLSVQVRASLRAS
jgi:hypothetical protein